MNSIVVAPSLLSADFSRLGEEIKAVEEAGADWIHVDVMDAHFVPNLTIGPPVVKSLRKVTKKAFDVHLMITDPVKYLPQFADAGADYLTVHIETIADVKKTSQLIRSLKVKPGLTLRPSTPLDQILPHLGEFDLILIMTVEPGFSGQSFMNDQIQKIKTVRRELDRLKSSARLQVDGGINEQTAKLCRDAGADTFVCGNFVFKNDYKTAIQKIKSLR